jgi:hypothetical protein
MMMIAKTLATQKPNKVRKLIKLVIVDELEIEENGKMNEIRPAEMVLIRPKKMFRFSDDVWNYIKEYAGIYNVKMKYEAPFATYNRAYLEITNKKVTGNTGANNLNKFRVMEIFKYTKSTNKYQDLLTLQKHINPVKKQNLQL